MIGRIGPVTDVQYDGTVSNAEAFRSPLIPSIDTNALSVEAASLGLLSAVGTTVAQGSWLNAATAKEPVAVLGAAAAQRLGHRPRSSRESGFGLAMSGSTSPASSSKPC